MRPGIFGLLAVTLLIGCGSDDEPVAEVDDGAVDTDIALDTGSTTDGTTDTGVAIDSGTSTDTGVASDTGTTPADTATDTAVSPSALKCGAATCDSKTQECCVIGGIGSCVATGSTCTGYRYGCTSVDTCGSGRYCCVSSAGTGGAFCAATSSCPTSHTCKTNADCSGSLKTCVDLGYIKQCTK